MSDSSPPPPPIGYKDRRVGLILFGVILIGIGALCGLFIPLTLLSQAMAAKNSGAQYNPAMTVPIVAVFSVFAITGIWLGVGSMLCRRWARALLLCLCSIGLICGIFGMVTVYLSLQNFDRNLGQALHEQGRALQPGIVSVVKIIFYMAVFVMYILIPGVLLLFYRSPNVKRTCEVRDPVERWTDRCPLPVLAICLLLAVKISLVPFAFSNWGSVVPVAGMLVHGLPARALWLAYALFSLYAARGFYRLQRHVWWIYLVVLILVWVSFLVTFERNGMIGYLRAVGFPEAQLRQTTNNPMPQGPGIIWFSGGLTMAVYVGYLCYLRRFFKASENEPSGPA